MAKAAFQAVDSALNQKERDFLKEKGRSEKHIWMIDDEVVFDLYKRRILRPGR
jgi:hypothetical protein